jgi:hypothetical protein
MTTMILIPASQLDPCCGQDEYAVVLKAKPDPLTLQGFLQYEAGLVGTLNQSASGPLAALKAELTEALSGNLTGLLARFKLLRKLNGAMKRFADTALEGLLDVAEDAQQRMLADSVAAADAKWFKEDVAKVAVQKDERLEFFRRSNALFMGIYLKESLPAHAKQAVMDLYQETAGMSIKERQPVLARDLDKLFGRITDAPAGYFKTFATNALNNARTYGLLGQFQRKGTAKFKVLAVLDGKTSNICRSLANKVFEVNQAIDRLEAMFLARDLDEIKSISPMVQGTAEAGFYYTTPDGRVPVDPDDDDALVAAGISFPPFHFNCRSTIQPITD